MKILKGRLIIANFVICPFNLGKFSKFRNSVIQNTFLGDGFLYTCGDLVSYQQRINWKTVMLISKYSFPLIFQEIQTYRTFLANSEGLTKQGSAMLLAGGRNPFYRHGC